MPENPLKAIGEFHNKQYEALRKLMPLAKYAANILKDLGHPSTAREIEAQLFAIESLDEEMKQVVAENPESFFAALKDSLRGER